MDVAVWVFGGGDEGRVHVALALALAMAYGRCCFLGIGPGAPAASSEDTTEDAVSRAAMIRVGRRGRRREGYVHMHIFCRNKGVAGFVE